MYISYVSPADGKVHRYFVDFIVKFDNGQTLLIEIKPHSQTLPPVPPKKKTHKAVVSFTEAARVYSINMAKWNAAKAFAARNENMQFVVFTEKELRKLGGPF